MRIALLEFDAQIPTATGVRGRAIVRHLRERGHTVDVLTLEPGLLAQFERSRFGLLSRVSGRLSGRRALPHLWDAVADRLEPQLK
jgi:hypothetical protein